MKLELIKISNIRNHKKTEISLNRGLNIFYGLNGSGKTSILEAISVAGFSKSFMPTSDSSVIRHGEDYFSVCAECLSDLDTPYKVRVVYKKGSRKEISSTSGDRVPPKEIIGQLPMIILTPDYKSITFGPPEHRRSFVDRLLSQASQIYIDSLYSYRRALKQRNNILNKFRTTAYVDNSLIAPWTKVLIESGAEIIDRRNRFINHFRPYFCAEYASVSDNHEQVDIQYSPFGLDDNILAEGKAAIEQALKELSKKYWDNELARGTTLFGPQKDDFRINVNDGLARDVASQGQHKSLLISLKFAEFSFLKERKNETPVILFDDIFSELDKKRSAHVIDMILKNKAQTMLTVTDRENQSALTGSATDFSVFKVDSGIVSEDNDG